MWTLELPWGPSDNHAIRHVTGRNGNQHRHYYSDEYKAFRKVVAYKVLAARVRKRLECDLRITVHASPPDKRTRDLTNLWKCLNDSLQYAGMIKSDHQFKDARILLTRGKPGTMTVFIEEMHYVGRVDQGHDRVDRARHPRKQDDGGVSAA